MIYTSFRCLECKKGTIVVTEELENTLSAKRYITCAHCNNRRIVREQATDDLRECMQARRYKRVKGYVRQVE